MANDRSTDNLQSWIGRRRSTTATLDMLLARRMYATMDGRIEDFGEPTPGGVVPPGWHWIWFDEAAPADRLGSDGHPRRGDFMPPVAFEHRMWAGGELRFSAPLRYGEEIVRESKITDIAEKRGRSGDLCFVTLRHDYRVERATRLREKQIIVYRKGQAATARAITETAAKQGEVTVEIHPDPVWLFRYSAVTFNGHRIHYDSDYARGEGYRAIVVHGPLIATLLLALAERIAGAGTVRSFSYSALSPLFANEPFVVHGNQSGNELALWATNPRGAMAMRADATL